MPGHATKKDGIIQFAIVVAFYCIAFAIVAVGIGYAAKPGCW